MPRCQTPDTAGLRSTSIVPVEGADPQRSHDSANTGGKAATGPLTLVAAYARVSSDRQDKEQTIDSQIDALRRAAEDRVASAAAQRIRPFSAVEKIGAAATAQSVSLVGADEDIVGALIVIIMSLAVVVVTAAASAIAMVAAVRDRTFQAFHARPP